MGLKTESLNEHQKNSFKVIICAYTMSKFFLFRVITNYWKYKLLLQIKAHSILGPVSRKSTKLAFNLGFDLYF